MLCRRDFVLENQHRPGGSGSNGSLIPTKRAPDLRAAEEKGSRWPREAAFLLQKELPLNAEQQQDTLLLTLAGTCWVVLGACPSRLLPGAPDQLPWGSLL